MKTISLKNLCATTSLLVGLGGMSSAQADFYAETLGAAASNVDVYTLTCPIGTTTVEAFVNDGANNAVIVSVQVVDPQGSATRQTAPNGGGNSLSAILAGPSAGSYIILVSKGQAGGEGAAVDLDCYIMGAPLAGFQSFLVQDQ